MQHFQEVVVIPLCSLICLVILGHQGRYFFRCIRNNKLVLSPGAICRFARFVSLAGKSCVKGFQHEVMLILRQVL